MDLTEFLDRYTAEVYLARDPEAAGRFIADPCLRHEHGELQVMSLADNQARIAAFLAHAPEFDVVNRLVTSDGEHAVSCFDLTVGGEVRSGIEVFRVADGKIVETWNTAIQPGAWG